LAFAEYTTYISQASDGPTEFLWVINFYRTRKKFDAREKIIILQYFAVSDKQFVPSNNISK